MTSPHLYALLVGIDRYQAGFNLNGCVNDIRAVKNFLDARLHQTPNILLLEDEFATRYAIINGFKEHLNSAGKGDIVLFYFCGHGARERVGKEFKDWELDNAHETIVCHDSRSVTGGKRVPDLADKELRYLISLVANKGENSPDHVLVVFDCCHSSSGTRNLEDGIRQIDDIELSREYADFCFKDDITIDRLHPKTFPQANHTFIAACLNTQTAKELIFPGESINRGLFTYSLLKELESQNAATLFYENLIREVQTRVKGFRFHQDPQLEWIEQLNCHNLDKSRQPNRSKLAFLGSPAIIKPRDPSFTLQFRPSVPATRQDPEQQAEWIINAGAFRGIQEGMELAVYPEGSQYEEFEIRVEKGNGTEEIVKPGSQTAIEGIKIKVNQVRATESVIEFVSGTLNRDSHQQFPAIVVKRPEPKVLFYFEGKQHADKLILERVKHKLQEEWKSLVVGVVSDRHQPHQYRLYAVNGQFEIRDGIDNHLLIEAFNGDDENPAINDSKDPTIELVATRVEHIARWTAIRDLENVNSSINKNEIEIEVWHNDKSLTDAHYLLNYEFKDGEWIEPQIRLKLKNKSNKPYFCTILDVKGDYSVGVFPVLEENGDRQDWIQLAAKQEYQATYEGEENLSIGIPEYLVQKGVTKYTETLKLIVSRCHFPVDSFHLNGLDISTERDIILKKKPPIGDWVTKQISFTYTRSNDAVEVNPNPQTELASGISVNADRFSVNASLQPGLAISSQRHLGSDSNPVTSSQPSNQQQEIPVSAKTASLTSSRSWFDTTHVVAIGIDQYTRPTPSLSNAVNDAITVAEIFGNPGSKETIETHLFLGSKQETDPDPDKIRKLIGGAKPGKATKEAIDEFLQNLEVKLKEKAQLKGKKSDRLVFYFAGHGVAIPFADHAAAIAESSTQNHKPQGYLLLQNADQDDPKTFLSLDILLDQIARIPVQHCLIILDSCFAGAVKWSLLKKRDVIIRKTCPSLLDLFIDSPAWQIITSADETQKANDGWKTTLTNNRGSGANSPFVMLLREALLNQEKNCYKNSVATATELNTYLFRELQMLTSSEGKRQTPEIFPILGKHVRGEFVFLQETFEAVREVLQEKSPDPVIDEKDNPYRGLLSYSFDDREIFFGRKRLIDQLVDRVKQNAFPLTIVLGASGSGKSSLVKAGLIPKLFPQPKNAQQLHKGWEECRPGRSPEANLEKTLEKLQIDNISQGERRLLFIDQFEEIETQCQDENQKNQFFKKLIDLLKTKKVDVVLTLRSDFVTTLRNRFESAMTRDNFESKTASNHWVAAQFPVRMMEPEELEEMIEKPASIKAVFFEDKQNEHGKTLVQQLSHEVAGMPGALPLLSVALKSMYQNFAQRYWHEYKLNGETTAKREITWDDYESLGGGVPGALRQKATEEYDNLKYKFDENYDLVKDDEGRPVLAEPEVTGRESSTAQSRKKMLRRAMLRMLTLKGREIVRRQVLESEVIYSSEADTRYCQDVLKRFASPEVRLLVSDQAGDDIYYEPAHDALVREWDYIAAWLEGKEQPDHAPQQSTSEQQQQKENAAQKSQSKPIFGGRLLTYLSHLFTRNGKSTNQESRPFNLTLLQELNTAANTWKNPALLERTDRHE